MDPVVAGAVWQCAECRLHYLWRTGSLSGPEWCDVQVEDRLSPENRKPSGGPIEPPENKTKGGQTHKRRGHDHIIDRLNILTFYLMPFVAVW